jgi:hypothetical protein
MALAPAWDAFGTSSLDHAGSAGTPVRLARDAAVERLEANDVAEPVTLALRRRGSVERVFRSRAWNGCSRTCVAAFDARKKVPKSGPRLDEQGRREPRHLH